MKHPKMKLINVSTARWIRLYRSCQLGTKVWNEFMGESIMPLAFSILVVTLIAANFVIIRMGNNNVIIQLSMAIVSITLTFISFMALNYKAKQYQHSVIALQARRYTQVSRLGRQLIRSCRPAAAMMGPFYIMDQHLVLLFLSSVLYYTVTLLVTFKG
jgi:hypothetical protein